MTIKAATLDLEIEQGATAAWQFTLRQGKNGQPFDLSNCSIRSEVKETVDDALPMASFTGTIIDQYNGTFVLSISKVESSKLVARRCVWDAFLDTPDGHTLKMFAGSLTVIRKVTT